MTDTLLFLHVLSAAALFTGLAAFTALVRGMRLEPGAVRIFAGAWQAGLVGVFIFGLALAFDIDDYDPWDAWILIALGLWLALGGLGDKLVAAYREKGEAAAATPGVARLHWIAVVLVVLLLADMIWKPWA